MNVPKWFGYMALMSIKKNSDTREDWRVKIRPDVSGPADEVFSRFGMSRAEALERLLAWVAESDDVVQAAVLGSLPESIAPDIARLVLEKMATPGASSSRSASKVMKLTDADPPRQSPGQTRRQAAKKLENPGR